MIKLIDVRETKCYSRDNSTALIEMQHTFDTRVEFNSDSVNIAEEVCRKLEIAFNCKLDPVPLYVTGDDTFYTFRVLPNNTTK